MFIDVCMGFEELKDEFFGLMSIHFSKRYDRQLSLIQPSASVDTVDAC